MDDRKGFLYIEKGPGWNDSTEAPSALSRWNDVLFMLNGLRMMLVEMREDGMKSSHFEKLYAAFVALEMKVLTNARP